MIALAEVGRRIDGADDASRLGKPLTGADSKVTLDRTIGGGAGERYLDFIYQPVSNSDGMVSDIFVEGQDVTERMRGGFPVEGWIVAQMFLCGVSHRETGTRRRPASPFDFLTSAPQSHRMPPARRGRIDSVFNDLHAVQQIDGPARVIASSPAFPPAVNIH